MKYYIYAPSYTESSGGSVVLHRLCHILNSIDGCQAFLVPRVPEKLSIVKLRNFLSDSKAIVTYFIDTYILRKPFVTNSLWNTPVIRKHKIKDLGDAIVIYPDVTFGNPLNGKNVVRWFLHQPGYFTKQLCFGTNELYYRFNSAIKDFNYCMSTMSANELKVIYYPLEFYNLDNVADRSGCCHAIRKGKNKPRCHPADSVLIDGMSHQEVADVFKKSKSFISYDDYTAYSIFAVLCGCESIVSPEIGVTKEQWYPNASDRYGIAYGFDDTEIEWAKKTRHKVLEHVLNEHKKSYENVILFVQETKLFFNAKYNM